MNDYEFPICLEHVNKTFRHQKVMNDISYNVPRGSVFALLGENGAGKTTTIKILLGIYLPDAGRTEVLGLDPRTQDIELRKNVGYVPEITDLYDWMSVGELGRFAASFYSPEYWPEYQRLVRSYGFKLSDPIQTLSKGKRALISLAIALANDPDLLILDEPTSGLDVMVRRRFLESMSQRAKIGKTVFLSSHQITEVERVATHIALMKKGKLLFVESMSSLKKTCAFLDLYFEKTPLPDQVQTLAADLFGELIRIKDQENRLRIFGRDLKPDFTDFFVNWEQAGYKIERHQIPDASLEEIFLAYMEETV